jgi:hypothetical protein
MKFHLRTGAWDKGVIREEPCSGVLEGGVALGKMVKHRRAWVDLNIRRKAVEKRIDTFCL